MRIQVGYIQLHPEPPYTPEFANLLLKDPDPAEWAPVWREERHANQEDVHDVLLEFAVREIVQNKRSAEEVKSLFLDAVDEAVWKVGNAG